METETLIEEKVKKKTEANKNLVLYNDNINTFGFVTECLIKYCKHELLQAEQCTYLVHYAGRCAVKSAPYEKLKPIHEALLENGLTSKIE
jgi:ATP-dependent Clp protease adaptor protein ClpS